jgi:ubiquitin-conjugating enzyme E2 Z
MSTNPYENEPGYENAHSDEDQKNQQAYIAKVSQSLIHLPLTDSPDTT